MGKGTFEGQVLAHCNIQCMSSLCTVRLLLRANVTAKSRDKQMHSPPGGVTRWWCGHLHITLDTCYNLLPFKNINELSVCLQWAHIGHYVTTITCTVTVSILNASTANQFSFDSDSRLMIKITDDKEMWTHRYVKMQITRNYRNTCTSRSFVLCGQWSRILWTPALRPHSCPVPLPRERTGIGRCVQCVLATCGRSSSSEQLVGYF